MKKFINPEIEIQTFAVEDVVTTSDISGGGIGGKYETPLDPS